RRGGCSCPAVRMQLLDYPHPSSAPGRYCLDEGVVNEIFTAVKRRDRSKPHGGGPASSSPAARHDGAAAGETTNLRNSIAAEGDALLAGTPASYVMYACTAAGTGPSNTTPLALGISLTL